MATTNSSQDGATRISKRIEKELHQTKVVIRRLPPDFTQEKLLATLSEIPPYSFSYFATGDPSLGDVSFSRAYFSFTEESSIIPFRDKYDGLYLESEKGVKYRAVVEFSPYQGVPKKSRKKPDSRIATIEQDPDYQAFLQTLEVKISPPTMTELAAYVDTIGTNKIPKVQKTPLIEYLESHRRSSRSGKRSKLVSDSKKKRGKESSSRGSSYSKDSEASKATKDYRSKPRDGGREKSEKKRDRGSNSNSTSSSLVEERSGKDKGGLYQERKGKPPEENGEVRTEGDRKAKEIRVKNRDRPDQVMYTPRSSREQDRYGVKESGRSRDSGNHRSKSGDVLSEYSRSGRDSGRDGGTDERPHRNRDDYGGGKERRYEGGKRGDGYRGKSKDASYQDRSKSQSK